MTNATPAIYIHGAWYGAVGDPKRVFRGHVTESHHPDFVRGAAVQVNYATQEQRQPDAAEHGTYELSGAGKKVPLMSFTCHAEATTGKQGTDDTQSADWQAVTLPAARPL